MCNELSSLKARSLWRTPLAEIHDSPEALNAVSKSIFLRITPTYTGMFTVGVIRVQRKHCQENLMLGIGEKENEHVVIIASTIHCC